VFHFGAADEYWIGSADMMHRNLDRRVEVLLRVADERLAAYLGIVLDSCLDPATRCWTLSPDGSWWPSPASDSGVSPVRDHQAEMMHLHSRAAGRAAAG
jgi:polyphosphate kinase